MAKKRINPNTPTVHSFLDPAEGYPGLLEDIKARIRNAQLKASISVNRELILLYWHIGRSIQHQQLEHGWGQR